MKLSKTQLRRIIRKTLREGAYEKLNDEATGSGMNLDQEVFFGLQEDLLALCDSTGIEPSELSKSKSIDEALCKKYAGNPRYAEYGVTVEDVLEELKNVIQEIG